LAGRGLAGRTVDARLEMNVAETTLAAARHHGLLPIGGEIRDECTGIGVRDHGADGHAQHDVFGAPAVLVGAAAVLAAPRAVDPRIAVVDQRVDVAIGDRIDAPAAATIT